MVYLICKSILIFERIYNMNNEKPIGINALSDRIQDKEICNAICNSFNLLYENDHYLIEHEPSDCKNKVDNNHHVGERTVVFRFAYYLQKTLEDNHLFQDLFVDCEYNRNLNDVKRTPNFPNGTYPDLILHKRGEESNNLLIMEFKAYWNKDISHDINKIKDFIDVNGDYGYVYGISVILGKKKDDVEIVVLKKK